MKKIIFTGFILLLLSLFLPDAWSHGCRRNCDSSCCGGGWCGGWGGGFAPKQEGPSPRLQGDNQQPTNPPYDQFSEEGKISEVNYVPGVNADAAMVEIRLLVGKQERLVRLAPVGFLNKNELSLKEGDTITIKGYQVATRDGELIVASQVQKAGKTLVLRNFRGRPVW